MAVLVTPETMDAELKSQLDALEASIWASIGAATDARATQLQTLLKSTSPKRSRTKSYATRWRVDQTSRAVYYSNTVYNDTKYRLTHILQNGHALTRNGRTIGSSPAIPHIDTATTTVLDAYYADIVAAIEEQTT